MTLHRLDPDREEAEEPGRGMRVSLQQGPPDHFVRVPVVVARRLMAELSGAEFKVLLFLVDRIYGHRDNRDTLSDTISYRQIQDGITTRNGRRITLGTGLARDTTARALKGLEARGLIIRVHRTHPAGGTAVTELQLVIPLDHGDAAERA